VTSLMDLGKRVLTPLLQRSDNISKVYFELSKRIFAPRGNVITHIGDVLSERVLPLMDMTGGSAGSFGETLVGISEVVSDYLIAGIDYLANTAIPSLLEMFNKATAEGGFLHTIKEIFGLIITGDFEGAIERMGPTLEMMGAAIMKGLKTVAAEGLSAARGGTAIAGGIAGAKLGSFLGPIGTAGGRVLGAGAGFFAKELLGLQQGGFAPGGPVMVGEQGPEILNIPRGSYVTNNEMMRAGVTPPAAQAVAATNGSSGGSAEIHLYMDSKPFASAVIDNINQRNALFF